MGVFDSITGKTIEKKVTIPQGKEDIVWVSSLPLGADVYVAPAGTHDSFNKSVTDGEYYKGIAPISIEVAPGSYEIGVKIPADKVNMKRKFEPDREFVSVNVDDPHGKLIEVGKIYKIQKIANEQKTLIALFQPKDTKYSELYSFLPMGENFHFNDEGMKNVLLNNYAIPPSDISDIIKILHRGGKIFCRGTNYNIIVEITENDKYGISVLTGSKQDAPPGIQPGIQPGIRQGAPPGIQPGSLSGIQLRPRHPGIQPSMPQPVILKPWQKELDGLILGVNCSHDVLNRLLQGVSVNWRISETLGEYVEKLWGIEQIMGEIARSEGFNAVGSDTAEYIEMFGGASKWNYFSYRFRLTIDAPEFLEVMNELSVDTSELKIPKISDLKFKCNAFYEPSFLAKLVVLNRHKETPRVVVFTTRHLTSGSAGMSDDEKNVSINVHPEFRGVQSNCLLIEEYLHIAMPPHTKHEVIRSLTQKICSQLEGKQIISEKIDRLKNEQVKKYEKLVNAIKQKEAGKFYEAIEAGKSIRRMVGVYDRLKCKCGNETFAQLDNDYYCISCFTISKKEDVIVK